MPELHAWQAVTADNQIQIRNMYVNAPHYIVPGATWLWNRIELGGLAIHLVQIKYLLSMVSLCLAVMCAMTTFLPHVRVCTKSHL